ncbi:MAG: 5-formyltetrahydrofolate cyclo-ligase [Hyphomicrobiales bacterium]|nr:MAG: 5-formyltetrahydrofolate cyclo-ligase [Hyphomicrobiales bacterium]
MADDLKVTISKLEARKVQSGIRKKLAADAGSAFGDICKYIDEITAKSPQETPLISLYNAIGAEFDLTELAAALRQKNVNLCMPVVVEIGGPLIFREWLEDSEMVEDLFRILSPSDANEQVHPDIVFVPLLAFDRKGFRLGYGGGFYDRTLAQLGEEIVSIGVGFAGQEMHKVPTGEFDSAVDYILTEKEFIEIGN